MGVKRYVKNIEKLNLDESTHKKNSNMIEFDLFFVPLHHRS